MGGKKKKQQEGFWVNLLIEIRLKEKLQIQSTWSKVKVAEN